MNINFFQNNKFIAVFFAFARNISPIICSHACSHFWPSECFSAWKEFKSGKTNKFEIQNFFTDLEDKIFELNDKLRAGKYKHGHYSSFFIRDPKLRHIHKANILDRILYQAVMRVIEPIFDPSFIFDSYSSRKEKGTHRAIKRLKQFAWKLSHNNTRRVWMLKCDIRKFFDSVDHGILTRMLEEKIADVPTMALIRQIISSFGYQAGKGIPFDQFMKRELRLKYYIRYADDFVILHNERAVLEKLLPRIYCFFQNKLKLTLHAQKMEIRKWQQGVDFLGYVIFPHYAVLRNKTKCRMFKKLEACKNEMLHGKITLKDMRQVLMSYMGMLNYCNGFRIKEKLRLFFKRVRADYIGKPF